MADHERYMRRAVEVARGNPDAPFGCVVVDEGTGEVLAEGLNDVGRNPMWHGEIAAIIACADSHPDVDWGRLSLYTTAEPCPMCSTAILWSGIPRLVYGTSIETLNGMGLPQVDLHVAEISQRTSLPGPEVTGGILKDECDALFEEMLRRTGS